MTGRLTVRPTASSEVTSRVNQLASCQAGARPWSSRGYSKRSSAQSSGGRVRSTGHVDRHHPTQPGVGGFSAAHQDLERRTAQRTVWFAEPSSVAPQA
jgi:hypothetical protein